VTRDFHPPQDAPEETLERVSGLTWIGLVAATLVSPIARVIGDTLAAYESGADFE
ncbi:MAG: hypothetical protein ACI9WU_004254, partial [Myxococcota bacterium]